MRVYFNYCCCLILCLLCFICEGRAQIVKVETKLDKSKIALGDQTILRLRATLPVADQISFPSLSDTISSKIQIVDIGKADTVGNKDNSGIQTITKSYTITSFEAGMQVVPAFKFKHKGNEFSTVPLPLEVQSVTVDTTKAIYDIKQPIAVKYTFVDWIRDNWHWLVFGFVCLLMLGAIAYYLKKMRKAAPVRIIEKPEMPPHLVALQKLQAIRDKQLLQANAVKQYHSELSDVIREYLEKRYKINALEQTSDEILSGLKPLKLKREESDVLRQLLQLADLVKFAKAIPSNTENELSMANAMSFIAHTKNQDQVVENKIDKQDGTI